MVASEGVNSMLDLVDLYWVIQGYGGDTASAIAKKIKNKQSRKHNRQ